MAKSNRGRPSRGARDAILAKPPVEFGAILKENAEREGLSYGDYLVALAAQSLNMPEYIPNLRDRKNELAIFNKEGTGRVAA